MSYAPPEAALPSSMPPLRVISVGTLSDLLNLRKAVLESAGFQVFTSSNAQQALLKIENGEADVLLLCYSVPEDARERLIQRFRQTSPQGRIVLLTNSPITSPPPEAGTVIFGLEGAEALIEAVRGRSRELNS